jgi:flagella basal body P-ring formation protein FlgA
MTTTKTHGRTPTTMQRTLLVALLAFGSSALAAADSIVLRSSVKLGQGITAVRLRDVAYLDGDAAVRLGDRQLADLGANASIELSLEEVRTKLVDASAAANLIDFSGKVVTVRSANSGKPIAMRGLALDRAPVTAAPTGNGAPAAKDQSVTSAVARVEFFADEATDIRTPRGLIAELIGNAHAEANTRIRIVITGVDAAFLDQVSSTRRFEVVPISSLAADRVRIRVIARDGDVAVGRTELIATPTLEASVATATGTVRRGAAIGDAVEVHTEFVAPSEFRKLAPATELDTVITTDQLKKGERVTDDKIRQPIEIKKNDKVIVRRELGSIAIEMNAIAEEDGTNGQVIRFRAVDRKDRRDRRTFSAEVCGPGLAIIKDAAAAAPAPGLAPGMGMDPTRTIAKEDA